MPESFKLIYNAVCSKKKEDILYWIPDLWINNKKFDILEKNGKHSRVEPYSFFRNQLKEIWDYRNERKSYSLPYSRTIGLIPEKDKIIDRDIKRKPGDWIIGSSLYAIHIRNFSAFDHDMDGFLGNSKSDSTLNKEGIRETGTFLKTLSLLPYIKSLGFNTILIAPISPACEICKKGEFGSPYAVKNPFQIDKGYHDTLLDEYSVDMEFKALIQACHILEIRVIMDFQLTAASVDSDFNKEHPDWFYFNNNINSYHQLQDNEQSLIRGLIYYKYYIDEDNIKVSEDGFKRKESSQGKPNKILWDTLISVIPYYQNEFGIDGARLIFSNLLPYRLEKKIIDEARKNEPDFCFVSDEPDIKAKIRKKGFNIVLGNISGSLSRLIHNGLKNSPGKKKLLELPSNPVPMLGAPELFDTLRAFERKGGDKFSKAAWPIVSTLPNLIPICCAGFELCEKMPYSLDSDFIIEGIKSTQKKHGFFDRTSLSWDSIYSEEMISFIKKINQFRLENLGIITNIDNFTFFDTDVDGEETLSPGNPVIAYMRNFQNEVVSFLTTGIFGEILYPIEVENDYFIVVNMDFENERIITVRIGREMSFSNIFRKEEYRTINNELNLKLKPGEYIIASSL